MKHLIVANWKCNPNNLIRANKLFSVVKKGIGAVKEVEVIVRWKKNKNLTSVRFLFNF